MKISAVSLVLLATILTLTSAQQPPAVLQEEEDEQRDLKRGRSAGRPRNKNRNKPKNGVASTPKVAVVSPEGLVEVEDGPSFGDGLEDPYEQPSDPDSIKFLIRYKNNKGKEKIQNKDKDRKSKVKSKEEFNEVRVVAIEASQAEADEMANDPDVE